MLLAIDVGNTNTVFGVFDGEDLKVSWRVSAQSDRSTDEYRVLLRQFFELDGIRVDQISSSIISCVVPPVLEALPYSIRKIFGITPFVIGPGIRTGMPIFYSNPAEVGADRIVNAVAGYEHFRDQTIVVDFGTATTFDCVSKKGEYLGGVISPGIHISMEALFQFASKLPRVELSWPDTIIGKSTVHSIQAGLLFGYVEMVDGVVRRIKREMGGKSRVIATGGLARLISKETTTIEEVDELLTLSGLRIIYDRNAASQG
jgi:type III pantothenate kinase